jgi:hypothetical protein
MKRNGSSDNGPAAVESPELTVLNILFDVFAEAAGATTLAVVADSRPRKARRFIGEHTSF